MLALFLFATLAVKLSPDILNACSKSSYGLSDRFELKGNLPALSAKAFDIYLRGCGFALQPLRFALKRGDVLFRLNNLVAHQRGRRHYIHYVVAAGLLLALKLREGSGGLLRGLLQCPPFMLRRRYFRGR